jgi:peptidoglycan/LPS O-acetylase OafA/YrhL
MQSTRPDAADLSAVNWNRKSAPLQYLRGVAAISVMLYHSSAYLMLWRKDDRLFRIFGDSVGLFGVTLFFVASGALMAMLAARADPSRFMLHRIIRIYPTYLLVATTFLLAAPLIGSGVTLDPWAFGLVPGGPHIYGLGVEWTLPFEIVFYVLVFVLILGRLGRHLHVVGAIWVGAIVLTHYAVPRLQADWQFPVLAHIPLAERTISFAAGLVIPWIVRRARAVIAAPVFGAAALVGGQLDPVHQIWWVSGACACFVAASLTVPALRARPLVSLEKLGDWSFALYLCHVQIIHTVLRRMPIDTPGGYIWIASVASSLAIGSVVGMVDIELYSALRRWADRTSVPVRRALAWGFLIGYLSAGTAWMLRPAQDIKRAQNEESGSVR